MTKLPHENRDVKGLDANDDPRFVKYKVGPLCSVPGCSRLADHPHHIWRRSFVIGDKPWVLLWDGTLAGNICGLCWRHHGDVTEGRTEIQWLEESHKYAWVDERLWFFLDPHPPVLLAASSGEDIATIDTSKIFPPENTPHEHVGPGAVEKCPTCSRALPRRSEGPQEGPRARKAWSVSVPVDERENGADVLDTLLNECAKLFGHDETKGARYFTLAQALALVVQHGDRMVGDE